MSPPDDNDGLPPNLPPIAERETLPEIEPVNDTEPPPADEYGIPEGFAFIPAGMAQEALSAALDDLARAFVLVEATAMALARQLDAQAVETT